MKKRFVLCINNDGYQASLIQRKIYAVIPDERAERDDLIRVMDESGEDYLFSANRFVAIELSEAVERGLIAA